MLNLRFESLMKGMERKLNLFGEGIRLMEVNDGGTKVLRRRRLEGRHGMYYWESLHGVDMHE